jgi:hypothetical protein
MTTVDTGIGQRRFEQLVGLIPELTLDGIRAASGTLYVQRDDDSVRRQAKC